MGELSGLLLACVEYAVYHAWYDLGRAGCTQKDAARELGFVVALSSVRVRG